MSTPGQPKLRVAVAISLLVALIAIPLAWFLLPTRGWVQSFAALVRAIGLSGFLIFALVYVVVVIALAPAEIMSIAAGLIFGAWGFPLVVISATAGAALFSLPAMSSAVPCKR